MNSQSQPTLTILNHTLYPDLPGGVEWRMWHTARTLSQEGVTVRVLTERRPGLGEVEQISPNLVIERFAPMRVHGLTRWHAARQVQRIGWWVNVLRRAKPTGPLWCNGYPMTTLAAVLTGRRRDVIFNPSTCVAATNRVARIYSDQTGGRLSRLFERLDGLAYRVAPRVVVSSKNLRDQLDHHYGRRDGVHVIPFGSNLGVTGPPMSVDQKNMARVAARRRLGLPPEAWVVGFVGRLDYCKDLPFLFNAVARCAPAFKQDLRVLVVGDGGLREKWQEAARALGIAERVHWAGMLSDPTPAYEAMDVMTLPSVYETFGLVVLEAMAAGVPVIGRHGDHHAKLPVLTTNEELIRDGVEGMLVDPHDPADLAARLEWLAADPLRVRMMSEHAAKRAAARTWRDYVADLMPLLKPACFAASPRPLAQAA